MSQIHAHLHSITIKRDRMLLQLWMKIIHRDCFEVIKFQNVVVPLTTIPTRWLRRSRKVKVLPSRKKTTAESKFEANKQRIRSNSPVEAVVYQISERSSMECRSLYCRNQHIIVIQVLKNVCLTGVEVVSRHQQHVKTHSQQKLFFVCVFFPETSK